MAVVSPAPVDVEAQRAELNAVLQSRCFMRAPKLAHLLTYLCEKLFSGQAHQIKEYSIGVEVFRRGDSFDQDSDSIVRVEANRLRRRLAEYYASEGTAHRLHIAIPVGQYVPDFELNVAKEPQLPVPDSASRSKAATLVRKIGGKLFPPRASAWWVVAALSIAVLGLTLLYLRQMKQKPTAANVPSEAPAASTGTPIGLPTGEEVRILAGASRSFVDHAGKLWNADAWFEGGAAVKSTVQLIWRTQDPGFYRTSRQGAFRYKIPLKKGIYELRLHFAETVYDPESTGSGGEGSRIMTVRVNGKPVLSRFDIAADAGGSRTADVKVFPNISPATDGFLGLDFAGEDGKQAALSAIEILPGQRGRIRPVRLLARQTPYYSNDSEWWSPDNYYEGGQMTSYSSPVSGTDDPELYETERWGNFSYAIPVAQGKYTVTLLFAVRHGNWDQSANGSGESQPPVAHIFNVFCNGKILLKDFDLGKEGRQTDVVVRKAAGLEPNAQGKLLLSFVPVVGYATVTGIEVVPQ